jgi:prophage DNA circulation protein
MANAIADWKTELGEAIALAQELRTHGQAKDKFAALMAKLSQENQPMADLVKLLWDEYIAAQRGSAFWQDMSEAEKALADGAMQQTIQSKQNYIRLVQEL